MKKFLALVIAAFLLYAPAASFAAAKQAGGKVDKGATQGDPGDTQEAIDLFTLSMSKKDAQKAGAKPTKDPNIMSHKVSWQDAEWQVTLMFGPQGLETEVLKTDIDHRVLMPVMENIKERGYRVLNVNGPDGKDIKFHRLAAEGKDDQALDAIFDKALESFVDAEKGALTVMFCPAAPFFEEVVTALKNKGSEDAALKKQAGTVFYVIRMDKKDDKMLVIVSTLNTLSK